MMLALGGEGHGDVEALPALIAKMIEVDPTLNVAPTDGAMRVGCLGRVLRPGQLTRLAQHAINKEADALVLVLDCDEGNLNECQTQIADAIQREHIPNDLQLGIILILREWEAMFLSCIEEIAASTKKATFKANIENIDDADAINYRDAKGRVASMIDGNQYIERLHQAAFTACIDVEIFSSTVNAGRLLSVLKALAAGDAIKVV